MSLLKSFLKGEQKPIPDEERTPMSCVDGTSFYMIENGSLLEKKVTHAIIKVITIEGQVPVAWQRIPNEGETYHGITAQSLKRFISSHGGEHELLTSWYNTWEEVQAEYKTGQGQHDRIITSPGKFEGEMLYVPLFWQVALEGFCDGYFFDPNDNDLGLLVECFCLDNWKVLFPPSLIESSLPNDEKSYLLLWETEQGFVNTEIKTKSEIAELDLPVNG